MNEWADQATIRERQKVANAVLSKLLDLDLPALSWGFTSVYLASAERAELEGQISGAHCKTDEDRRAALEAWAAHFAVTPDPDDDGEFVYVRFVIDGVDVEVWAGMDGPRKRQSRKRALAAA